MLLEVELILVLVDWVVLIELDVLDCDVEVLCVVDIELLVELREVLVD